MKRYIRAAIDTTPLFRDFMQQIEDIYYAKFPKSSCDVYLSEAYGEICGTCYMAENMDEWAYGLSGNDLFHIKFNIGFKDTPKNLDDDDQLLDVCKLWFISSNSIMVEPDDDYHYCKYFELPDLGVTGTYQEVLVAWQDFVDILYNETCILYHAGKLHHSPLEYFDIKEKLQLN